ncbi:MAG: ornithine carbamoyltransferase [Puniceicoccaceae bacterium]
MLHFLRESDFTRPLIEEVFSLAREFKRTRSIGHPRTLEGQSWALLFYKNSTRTRISFEVAIRELGGHPVVLSSNTTQINRGESVADSMGVFNRYLHGIIIRTHGQEIIDTFARYATIPVVNALTDLLHPCQIYSDVLTIMERFHVDSPYQLAGRTVAFFGDTASNMANSLLLAGHLFGFEVRLSGPESFVPGAEITALLSRLGAPSPGPLFNDPLEAARGADVLYTDVWVSMGDEAEEEIRIKKMRPFSVTPQVLASAQQDAIFMHCMPTHPGFEVSEEVLASPASILLDQAENRLHMQKAILSVLAEDLRSTR